MTAGVGQVMNDTRAPGDIQADRPAEPPLLAALTRLAGLQREVVDLLALQEAAAAAAEQRDPVRALSVVAGHLQLRGARWRVDRGRPERRPSSAMAKRRFELVDRTVEIPSHASPRSLASFMISSRRACSMHLFSSRHPTR